MAHDLVHQAVTDLHQRGFTSDPKGDEVYLKGFFTQKDSGQVSSNLLCALHNLFLYCGWSPERCRELADAYGLFWAPPRARTGSDITAFPVRATA